MKEYLLSKIEKNSNNFETWYSTFEKFAGSKKIDSKEKIEQFKNEPDYCTWEQTENGILLLSYRYANYLDKNGTMYCVQEATDKKINGISNFKKLDKNSNLPILDTNEEFNNFIYTVFKSPNNTLGYPPPYDIFSIMYKSKNVVEDFYSYIRNVVDNHINLLLNCNNNNILYFRPSKLLTSHFTSPNFYFKDTMFFSESSYTNDEIIKLWVSTLDGFKRAEGIFNAYRSRSDYALAIEKDIYLTITELQNYVRTRCRNL